MRVGFIGDKVDLLIRQGGTFGPLTITLQNPDATIVDLTGASIFAQLRKFGLSPDIVQTFDVSIVDAAAGKFSIGISAANTALITCGESLKDVASKYVWDCELHDTLGRVTPIYFGDVAVFREVTK